MGVLQLLQIGFQRERKTDGNAKWHTRAHFASAKLYRYTVFLPKAPKNCGRLVHALEFVEHVPLVEVHAVST